MSYPAWIEFYKELLDITEDIPHDYEVTLGAVMFVYFTGVCWRGSQREQRRRWQRWIEVQEEW